jgi:hypothetical protein
MGTLNAQAPNGQGVPGLTTNLLASSDPNFPAPGASVNVFKAWHDYWTGYIAAGLEGTAVVTSEVSFTGSTGSPTARLDLVVGDLGDPTYGIEVKTQPFLTSAVINPWAYYSTNQSIVYPQIRNGSAIPVGDNASLAGFQTGVLLGTPFPIHDVTVVGNPRR